MEVAQKALAEWMDDAPLGASEVRFIELALPGSGNIILRTDNVSFLTYGLYADTPMTLNVDGSIRPAFASFVNVIVHGIGGFTFTTPFQLAGNLGLNGYHAIVMPYLRLKLTETSAVAQTQLYFYARAWG